MTQRDLQAEHAVLREAFPGLPDIVIEASLRRNSSNVEAAAAELLQNQETLQKKTTKRAQQRPRSASWGTLSDAAKRPIAPQFSPVVRQPQAAPLAAADFPAGPVTASPAVVQPPGPWQPQLAANALMQHGHQQLRRQPLNGSIEQLLRQHAWAGRELVAAVLEAAGQDAGRAAALLAEMVASDGPQAADASQVGHTPAAAPAQLHAGDARQTAAAASLSCTDPHPAGNSEEEDDEAQQDPYFKYRRHALTITRRWQQASRAAAAAYGDGRHSDARQLAAQVQRLRQEALAAHAEAAEQIETDNNRDNGLFELDLHGLHAAEATAALDRRLALLHTLLAEPATAAAAAAGAPDRGQRLRVVVGRGTHSSGGEASIPRVVENHLKAAGHRFQQRLGAIDVQLRSVAALGAATARTPQPGQT